MKAIFVITCSLILSFSSLMGQEHAKNVLFIAVDDLKPLLNSYGYEQMVTPNIDKLANNGVVFQNAHCQQAVCGPSRASIMTGMTPDYTGVWDLRTRMRHVNQDILTMPEYFKEQGYETVAIGKIYDPRCVDKEYDKPSWSIPYKVSSVLNYPEEWGEPALSYYADMESKKLVKKYEQEAIDQGLKNKHDYVSQRFKPAVENCNAPDEAYMDGQIANNAMAYLENLSKDDKPFFLAVGFKRPHLPFAAPKKYWDLYKRDEIQLAEYQKAVVDGVDIAYHNHGELLSYTDIPPLESFSDIFSELIPEDKQKELIHGYYASTSFIDAQIGKVLDKLKELGLDKNTTIVLWGDHGWHLGDHALWCKHTNFEQATRVPLIISTPNGEQGNYKYPVDLIDVFPTMCESMGIKVPEHLQGKSLLPAMANQNKAVKNYAVSQFDRGQVHGYSVRTEKYRLTLWMDKGYRTYSPFDADLIYDGELYDYEKDALETKNLYRDKDYQEIREQLTSYFKEYVARQNEHLKNAGSNPKNANVGSIPGKLNMDGTFNLPIEKNWKTIARKGAIANFEVIENSEIGDHTFKVEVEKLGQNPWDLALITTQSTFLEENKELLLSFGGRGGKVQVILKGDSSKPLKEELILGQNTYIHRLSFNIPQSGNYSLKFQFAETGIYLIDDIKSEYQ